MNYLQYEVIFVLYEVKQNNESEGGVVVIKNDEEGEILEHSILRHSTFYVTFTKPDFHDNK